LERAVYLSVEHPGAIDGKLSSEFLHGNELLFRRLE
jgi:hypothetical protein